MKNFTPCALIAVLALLAGCGMDRQNFLEYDVTPAKLAKPAEVKGCKDLGPVRGKSQTTGSGNISLARITARDDLLKQAGVIGGTHVVIIRETGSRRPEFYGRAYKCE